MLRGLGTCCTDSYGGTKETREQESRCTAEGPVGSGTEGTRSTVVALPDGGEGDSPPGGRRGVAEAQAGEEQDVLGDSQETGCLAHKVGNKGWKIRLEVQARSDHKG